MRVRAWLLCAALSLAPARAFADEAALPAAFDDEAKRQFEAGLALLMEGKPGEALEELQRSFALAPSPNTRLLMARCLRDLGKLPDAARAYDEGIRDAEARIERGDARFRAVIDEVEPERQKVLASVASVRVKLPPGARVRSVVVAGAPVAVWRDETSSVYLRPGPAEILVTFADGVTSRRSADAKAGVKTVVSIDPETKPDAGGGRGDLLVPAFVATGVGVAGMGLFAGFGASAKTIYDDLEHRCGGRCSTVDERADADRGKAHQSAANVGLAFGVTGLAIGATLFVVHFTTPKKSVAGSFETRVGAGRLDLQTRF